MDNTTIKQLAQDAQKYIGRYGHIGIRIQTELHGAEVGEMLLHQSSIWDDGNEMDLKLDGVSAIDVTKVNRLDKWGGYDGHYVLILGSDYATYGSDPAEIEMRNPVILEIAQV